VSYIIGGPTASGKSKLALWLAQHVDGEIINADSLQLYKSIPILSASPDNEELAQTRHHLFGIYHDDQISTVQAWTQLAQATIKDIKKRQKTPIIVGGTGMYLNALIQGLSPIPDISNEIKKSVRILQKNLSTEDFYQQVIDHDPSIQGYLHKNDKQRLGRALEVMLQTGESIKHFQGKAQPLINHIDQFIITMPEKNKLYELINARTIKMLENGAMQEVQALRQNITLDAPVCKAIGVKEIWQYLENEITKEEMICLLQQATRQYAKRQMTWFKNQVNDPLVITDPFDSKQITQLVQRKSTQLSLERTAS
jgi:tRNA dimethylallyltransferase